MVRGKCIRHFKNCFRDLLREVALTSSISFFFIYRKVASRSTSRLVARPGIFWLFMKGKFDPYVLWPLAFGLWPLNSRPVCCSRLYGKSKFAVKKMSLFIRFVIFKRVLTHFTTQESTSHCDHQRPQNNGGRWQISCWFPYMHCLVPIGQSHKSPKEKLHSRKETSIRASRQSYEIKLPPQTILGFEIVEIFSVENYDR